MVQEFKGNNPGEREKKPLTAGYTLARIKSFNKDQQYVDPRKLAHSQILHIGKTVDPASRKEVKGHVKIEIAKITGRLLGQVWQKIFNWIKSNPPALVTFESYDANLEVLSRDGLEEIKKMARQEGSRKVVDMLNMYTQPIFNNLTKEWMNEQNTEQDALYRRYVQVLWQGMSNVTDLEKGTPVINPGDHIGGGFRTARFMNWRLIKILPEIFEQQHGREPTNTELMSLLSGTKPLVIALANCDALAMNVIEANLEDDHKRDEYTLPRSNDFDPNYFWVSKKGDKYYLEIKPEILDKVARIIKTKERDIFRTGCPALLTEGVEGQNMVSELFDWFARLYKEFYIDAREKN